VVPAEPVTAYRSQRGVDDANAGGRDTGTDYTGRARVPRLLPVTGVRQRETRGFECKFFLSATDLMARIRSRYSRRPGSDPSNPLMSKGMCRLHRFESREAHDLPHPSRTRVSSDDKKEVEPWARHVTP